MRHFFQVFSATGATLRQMFQPVVTVQYPKVIRPRGERYRASFALTHEPSGEESCIACSLCELICPSNVITVTPGEKRVSEVTGKKRGYLADYTLDATACIFCELCVQVCPTDSIVMTRVPAKPAYAREDLVLTMDKLYANEKAVPLAWSNGTRLCEMQDPARADAHATAKAVAGAAAAPAPTVAEVA